MNTDVMFSSKTCEWETPIEFFKKLAPCANRHRMVARLLYEG